MKIAGSSIAMNSEHLYSESNTYDSLMLETRSSGAKEAIEAYAKHHDDSVVAGMRDYQKQEELDEKQRRKENEQNMVRHMLERMHEDRMRPNFEISDETDLQIRLLRKLLAALNGKSRPEPLDLEEMKRGKPLDLRSSNMKRADMVMALRGSSSSISVSAEGIAPKAGTTVSGTTWQRITAVSATHNESEYTTFQSTGLAITEDGRQINFGVELSMSRSFSAKFESLTAETFIMTDPLIINIDNKYAGLSDVKFKFDLDNDGRQEDISFAGEGSGFLALDKNGNGKIDNGSELFGTASGNGFADLAAYDDDGNFWIDENDEIYSKLKVWTKDADGNDRLIDLKEADVGAIYLGSASTEFSLKDGSHSTLGAIRRTGIYLKESGDVGTIQHVDIAT